MEQFLEKIYKAQSFQSFLECSCGSTVEEFNYLLGFVVVMRREEGGVGYLGGQSWCEMGEWYQLSSC